MVNILVSSSFQPRLDVIRTVIEGIPWRAGDCQGDRKDGKKRETLSWRERETEREPISVCGPIRRRLSYVLPRGERWIPEIKRAGITHCRDISIPCRFCYLFGRWLPVCQREGVGFNVITDKLSRLRDAPASSVSCPYNATLRRIFFQIRNRKSDVNFFLKLLLCYK